MSNENPIVSREDAYLNACNEESGCAGLPTPISREDKYLYELAEKMQNVSNAVHYTADLNKTAAEKTQARTNIGQTAINDELTGRINNLQSIGRFLSLWNSATGLPETDPTELPYTYRTGDYFRVSVVGATTNYKPNGATYTGTASTTAETEDVTVGAVYYFDGTTWKMQASGGGGTANAPTVKAAQDATLIDNTIYRIGSVSALAINALPATGIYGIVFDFDVTASFSVTSTTTVKGQLPSCVSGQHYQVALTFDGTNWVADYRHYS